ncbi:MAG: hypothetical protein R6U13_02710 [Desulfatiglandaceae bacterium]
MILEKYRGIDAQLFSPAMVESPADKGKGIVLMVCVHGVLTDVRGSFTIIFK